MRRRVLCGRAARTNEALEPDVAVEHPRRRHEGDLKVMTVPPQPLLHAFALVNEVVAVIDDQPHVLLGPAKDASGRPGSRRAALATQAASIGSDLP